MHPFRYLLSLQKLPFVRDVLTIQAGSMIFMMAGFLASVAFARLLGREQYGLYAVTLAFAGTASQFLNIGQGQSLYVFFSEAHASGDRRAMAAVLKNFLVIACANVLLLGALAAAIPFLGNALYGESEIGQLAQILCIFQITDLWNSANLTLLQAVRRVKWRVTIEQSQNLTYLALAVLSLLLGYGVRGIFLSQLLVSALFLVVSVLAIRDTAKRYVLPGVRETLRVPWRESEQYFKQGLVITLDKSIGNFFPQGLYFVMSLFVPKAFIGVVKISMQLAMIPRSILLPQAGELSVTTFAKMKAESSESVRRGARKLISHALGFHALLSVCAIVLAPFVITSFYGPEFHEAIPITVALIVILLLQSLGIANSPILRLYRRTHISILDGIGSWAAMIIVFIATVNLLGPAKAFVLTFLVGQLVPLLLPLYIFKVLLRGESQGISRSLS